MKVWELREALERADPDALVVLNDPGRTGVEGAEVTFVRVTAAEGFPAVVLRVGRLRKS